MFIFSVTDATGAISGYPHVKVYDSRGRLKGFGGTPVSGVTSVGLSMPNPANPAFTVTNSPVTSTGVLTVTANGTASQYIDGTGALQTFPTGYTYTVDNGLTENPAGNFQLGGTLIQNTTITGANFNFTYTGLNRFLVDTDQFVNISSVSGSDTALVDVSTLGASPYVDLNVKNGTNTHSIYVDDTQIILRTPGVDAGSVSNGDVLTLTNAVSGKVEFQTPIVSTYTVDNGLTESPANNFQLGGPLIQDTNIDGVGSGTWMLDFTNLHSSTNSARYSYSFATNHSSNNTLLSLDSLANVSRFSHEDSSTVVSAIELTGTELRVQTPLYSTKTAGDVLTLSDPTTGEAEWQTISGLNPGFQDVLINDSTLTQNNTVNGANFNFTFSGFNRYSITTDEYISLESTSGSKIATVSVNTLGVAPYVDLNTKNGGIITGLYVDTTQVLIRTPGVNAATVSNGYVLTLTDATSGKVEFQTAPTTGDSLSPLLLMGG